MTVKATGARAEVLFPLISLVLDALSIIASFGFSYWIRFFSPLTSVIPVSLGIPTLKEYLIFSMVAAVIFCTVFAVRGLYRLHGRVSTLDELERVMKAILLSLPWLFSVAFFYRGFSYSRLVFVLIVINSLWILTTERAFIQSLQRKLYRRGVGVLQAAVCGSGTLAVQIHDRINGNPHLGYRSLGFITANPPKPHLQPILGSASDIDEILRQQHLDMLFIALDPAERSALNEIIARCEGINLEFFLAPDQVILEGKAQPFTIAGLPLLKIKESPLFGWRGVIKRAFDLIIASIFLVVLSPFLLLLALSVKLTSRGPLFYHQERIGLDGKIFNMHKFRTMIPNAEAGTGPVWASKTDNRTTKVGKILRRLSLDELPQLYNVLVGDMSVVGPRPERPHFVKQFRQTVPKYVERHRVRSGVTGWAQVSGFRGDTSIEERTRYDLYYVENWSLAFDLKILILTIKEVLFSKDAY
ncbi:MAG: undecaprenyl-phosphate glucose phosphotransferase [bacterium]|nr:undecaprenyl-phosphate glucose phosphotransferase [bacterium]